MEAMFYLNLKCCWLYSFALSLLSWYAHDILYKFHHIAYVYVYIYMYEYTGVCVCALLGISCSYPMLWIDTSCRIWVKLGLHVGNILSFATPWRIHGAGIYANIKGVYWWDPYATIYIYIAAPWILWLLIEDHKKISSCRMFFFLR